MRNRYVIALVAGFFVLASPIAIDSCGIADPTPVFSTRSAPADVRGEFFRGRIGVLVSSWDRCYLIAAYRLLAGRPFAPEEVEAFLTPRRVSAGNFYSTGLGTWQQARLVVPGTAIGGVRPYKEKTGRSFYFVYTNCLDDAFVSASATLKTLADRWGANSSQVRDWLAAQDKVFANCSAAEPVIPDDPSAAMEPSLAAERRYQIAAAHLYAGRWELARQDFQRIAEDRDSRWRGMAPYLIARVSLREGMVDENSPQRSKTRSAVSLRSLKIRSRMNGAARARPYSTSLVSGFITGSDWLNMEPSLPVIDHLRISGST